MLPGPDILALRLARQLIERPAGEPEREPAAVVAHLGAMQAQDYAGALWSVGLRSKPGTTLADVERAIAERHIVRTWPMRGTLHFVAPGDVRWMLALLSYRVLARAVRRHAQLDLTEKTFEEARRIFTEALAGGGIMTRGALMTLLATNGINPEGQRGYHILWMLALRGVLCCGPVDGKQQTFVLLDEWVPPGDEQTLGREEALAQLANRYIQAHGPATEADFAWWAGITKTDARIGLEAIAENLQLVVSNNVQYWIAGDATDSSPASGVHLLPGFDEYFLGYADRSLALGEYRETYGTAVSANGVFSPTLVIDGRVSGTWKRTRKREHVDIMVTAFRKLTAAERRGLDEAAQRYGQFLGLEARIPTPRSHDLTEGSR